MLKKHSGLAVDSILLAFVRALTYVSSIVQAMVMSRVFTKFEYGRYSQACLVVTFLAPLFLLGLSNAVNYFFNKTDENREAYISTIYNLILGIGLTGGLFIMLSRSVIAAYFHNSLLIPLLYIVAFRPLLQNLLSMIQVLYISSGHAKMVALRNTVLSIIQLLIVFVAVLICESVTLVLALLVITDLFQVIVLGLYLHFRVVKLRLFFIDRALTVEIMKYSVPLALSTMVGTITLHMDMLLIGKMLSTEQFALYSNMARELPFNFLIASFTDVVFPKIIQLKARGDVDRLAELYKAYVQFGLFSTWIMISGAAVCSKEIILILYSQKYIEGEMIFVVYLFVSLLRFTYCGMLLSAAGQSRKIFSVSVLALFVNLVLNIALFLALGMIGPAVSTVIAVFTANFLQLLWGVRTIGCGLGSIFDWKKIGLLVLESAVLGIALRLGVQSLGSLPAAVRLGLAYTLNAGTLLLLNRRTIVNDLKLLNRG